MLPLIASAAVGLLPTILDLAPGLAEHLIGPRGKAVAETAKGIVERVVGSSDPAAIAGLPPEKRAELQLELARLSVDQRRIDLEERKAELANTESARLAGNNSKLVAWTQVVSFFVVLSVWCAMVLRFAFYGLPPGNESGFVAVLVSVSGILGGYIQFFIGNATSAGAANRRMDLLASMATQQGQPAAVATTAPVTINQGDNSADALNDASLRRARSGLESAGR